MPAGHPADGVGTLGHPDTSGGSEFDDRLSADWLVAVTVKLGHAASEEVDAGRMSGKQATRALHTSLLRVFGATTP
ncbi:hypothetical protein [Amycolatopsis anabasis]|uniref:hypothetical protein n=1 Tax=Amycolatopsis anabasis TaxID=1840409 RepID=UPI001C554DD7|nr:hypothetical protein [Amycolatopsis anabasis]